MSRHLPRLALLLLLGTSAAGAQTLLQPGSTYQLDLPGGHVTLDLAIDVPASARMLDIGAEGPEGSDIDLLLRHGEPFPPPPSSSGRIHPGSDLWLFEHAHYQSLGPGATERLTVTRNQKHPLRAGRWHLALVNWSAGTTRIQVTTRLSADEPGPVQFEVDFADAAGCAARGASTAPWFDSTPVQPIQGNDGTTRGRQRQNAFMQAISRLQRELRGVAGVRILACWATMGGTATSATLASAGPTYVINDDGTTRFDPGDSSNHAWSMPFLDRRYTWYTAPGAAQRAGTEFCRLASTDCDEADLFIRFNTDVDGGSVLGSRRFHYGYDAPPGSDIDFISVAMHEITHGLGFLGLYNLTGEDGEIGSRLRDLDDAFSAHLAHVQDGHVIPLGDLPPARVREAVTSSLGLRWVEPEAVNSQLNPWRERAFPLNLPAMHAPQDGIKPGSTLSHFSELMPFTENMLMKPSSLGALRTLGLAQPVLSVVGWRSRPADIMAVPPPYGGQWFDPARNGHGLDLHRVPGSSDTYVMVLYTFDRSGRPEWYTAAGRIVDGVFRPQPDANGNSLQRVRYTDIHTIPMQRVADPSVPGDVRIDFGPDASRAPACRDGTGRNGPLALMTFSLGDDINLKWCLTQITPRGNRPAIDFTGHRYGDGDVGWGLTTLAFNTSEGDGLFAILYFPDGEGQPRWAAAQVNDFRSGEPMPLYRIQGYCRTCPSTGTTPVQIGTLTLRLADPPHANGGADYEVRFDGPGSLRFSRTGAVLRLLADSGGDD